MNARPLRKLYLELKREYPDLLGLGIGLRTQGGRIRREPAIRLVVAKKRSSRSKSYRRLPRQVELKLGKGKRPVTLRMFTDVEDAGQWVPTSFPLLINGTPEVNATCYARWRTPADRKHVGVVTVAHAFQGANQAVGITVRNTVAEGFVYARSDLIHDHLDVGLVAFRKTPQQPLGGLPDSLNPSALSTKGTIDLLGESDTDALYSSMDIWYSQASAQGRALAYYVARSISNPGGPDYVLNGVVLADGPPDTFVKGRSGSPWVSSQGALALQSHGHQGLSFRLGLGTHLAEALTWLSNLGHVSDFSWAWRVEDLA